MALTLPARLRNAELNALSKRAAQLDKVKPAISYWCYYQIVNHILKDGLHTHDDESKAYTMELMDKLEEMKTEYPQDDTITDDVAAQAYVEQFALETLQRAENAMDANKVTNQTADTLLAAATFLDLLAIWSPPTAETSTKVKFAKYHAVRIVRAIKAGQDPNTSNPVKETQLADESAPALDPNDPDVQAINGTKTTETTAADESQVEQEANPVGNGKSDAPGIMRTTTSGMTPSTSNKPDSQQQQSAAVSPGAPSPLQPDDRPRQDSLSDGYFPRVSPASPSAETPADEPSVSPNEAGPTFSEADVEPKVEAEDQAAAPSAPVDTAVQPVQPMQPAQTVPPTQPANAPSAASKLAQPARPVQQVQPVVQAANNYVADDEAVAAAMKHAKWATSALNFDDVPTAVKELREALRSLGAS